MIYYSTHIDLMRNSLFYVDPQNEFKNLYCHSILIIFTEYFSIYKVYIVNSEEIADSLLKYSLSIFIN